MPGLTPTRQQAYAQGEKMQSHKDGIEVDKASSSRTSWPGPTPAHLCHDAVAARSKRWHGSMNSQRAARSISAPPQ